MLVITRGKPPFSYGFPMVFLWFSYGFPIITMENHHFPVRKLLVITRPGHHHGMMDADLQRSRLHAAG